jgi:hypothetical protein
MLVAAGFMPASKYRQKNFLMVYERGRKARGYEPGSTYHAFFATALHSLSRHRHLLQRSGILRSALTFFETIGNNRSRFGNDCSRFAIPTATLDILTC